MFQKREYFDFASFTPICKSANREIKKVLTLQRKNKIANPFSAHTEGRKADMIISQARESIGRILGVQKHDIIFTSGATEANRIILNGVFANFRKNKDAKNIFHIITSNIEHKSIYRYMKHLQQLGAEISFIDTDKNGVVSKEELQKALREDTRLVSITSVYNETGVVQPIRTFSKIIKEYEEKINSKIFIHTDAAQAGAYETLNPSGTLTDAITLDSTKMFGPQGVGCMYVNRNKEFLSECGMNDIISIRPGTPSVALISGFAEAFKWVNSNRRAHINSLKVLRNFFIKEVSKSIPNIQIYGIDKDITDIREKHLKQLSPHIIRIVIPEISHEYLATLLDTKGFAVSTHSACSTSGKDRLGKEIIGIRISFAPFQNKKSVTRLVNAIKSSLYLAKDHT